MRPTMSQMTRMTAPIRTSISYPPPTAVNPAVVAGRRPGTPEPTHPTADWSLNQLAVTAVSVAARRYRHRLGQGVRVGGAVTVHPRVPGTRVGRLAGPVLADDTGC